MNPRNSRRGQSASARRSSKLALGLAGLMIAAACVALLIWEQRPAQAPASEAEAAPSPTPAPTPRVAIEFHMADFDHGWIRYADGAKVTDDGGVVWREAEPGQTLDAAAAPSVEPTDPAGNTAVSRQPATIVYAAKVYSVRQTQFLTERIGWALPLDGSDFPNALLVTADGGETWQAEVTAAVKEAVRQEKERLQRENREAALYASADVAKQAIRAKWTVMPETASPGDVVLVRHDGPGEVAWQGKTYTLQPFGAGYFTYVPIAMGVKPGHYPIGDRTLTIQAKKFETQYLQVTEQMESMRQDTKRIAADQARIDAARSKSQPEFLFTEPFLQPIDGILTTPYGYTRYVNGKYDSSHMAIDLAAKEGTPIKATNDGIVALADSLYLTGNSIYLDHGMGLFSQYAHMSELKVKAGDRVKRGDIIGLVGTTGFSTGPHLHFTFWANNVQANPDLFFGTTPFRWLEPKQ